jgi:hypothetical protein
MPIIRIIGSIIEGLAGMARNGANRRETPVLPASSGVADGSSRTKLPAAVPG